MIPQNQMESFVNLKKITPAMVVAAKDVEIADSSDANTMPLDSGLSLLPFLPPMPRPDYRALRLEQLGGTALIMVICGLCIGVAHGLFALTNLRGELSTEARSVVLGVVYGMAALAFTFRLSIVFGDCAGIIRRSRANCLPVPPEALDYLRKAAAGERPYGQMLRREVGNIRHEDGRSYCVRCCVWRHTQVKRCCSPCGMRLPWCSGCDATDIDPHHCSTCGRCVSGFDHHCGVLGACITESNMFPFNGLIALGVVAPLYSLFLVPASSCAILAFTSSSEGSRWIATTVLIAEAAAILSLKAWFKWGDPISHCFRCFSCLTSNVF